MADEPSNKKSRMTEENDAIEEKANERFITINLTKYPEWVGNSRDDELEEVFHLGVIAKESVKMTVYSKQNNLEKALVSQLDLQMKNINDRITDIKNETKTEVLEIQRSVVESVNKNIMEMTTAVGELQKDVRTSLNNIGTRLTNDVGEVANKVPPLDSINSKIEKYQENVLKEVRNVHQSVQELGKPSAKGAIGEMTVLNILVAGLSSGSTVQDVSRKGSRGDVLVTTVEGEKIPIEVKNHENPVTKQEIEKFEKVVAESSEFKVGILLSLKSGIARRSKRGKFEICQDKNKYFIFVPNAMKEENLIVWSVMLANELAQITMDLKDTQKQKLCYLYEMFSGSADRTKNCRRDLETLESTVKKLKENMVPILDIVDQSKDEVYKMLHQS